MDGLLDELKILVLAVLLGNISAELQDMHKTLYIYVLLILVCQKLLRCVKNILKYMMCCLVGQKATYEMKVQADESPGTVDDKLSIVFPVAEDEVRQLVNKSPSNSCSLDPVPAWFLKEHLDCLLPSITITVNLSMSTIIVPTKMKSALVTPLLKNPSLGKDVMKNFRPVSNMSFISKLTEMVVLNRLINHVSRNNLQEKFQSAYKPNHSAETALMRIQNDILMTLGNKRVSCSSYLIYQRRLTL